MSGVLPIESPLAQGRGLKPMSDGSGTMPRISSPLAQGRGLKR